jgi:hypothetical protein
MYFFGMGFEFSMEDACIKKYKSVPPERREEKRR